MAKTVYTTHARETGALIELYDAKAVDNSWDSTGDRWVIVCNPHHEHTTAIKQSDAYKLMVLPSKWCSRCASLKAEGKKVSDKEPEAKAEAPVVAAQKSEAKEESTEEEPAKVDPLV